MQSQKYQTKPTFGQRIATWWSGGQQVKAVIETNNPTVREIIPINPSSQIGYPYPMGDSTYANIEERALQTLISLIFPSGIAINHKEPESDKILQKTLDHIQFTKWFKDKAYRLIALRGDSLFYFVKNGEYGELYVNDVMSVSGVKIKGFEIVEVRNNFNLSDGNTEGYTTMLEWKNNTLKQYNRLEETTDKKTKEKNYPNQWESDLGNPINTFNEFKEPPFFYFQFKSHKNILAGQMLTQRKFNFACSNMQQELNRALRRLAEEVIINHTVRIIRNAPNGKQDKNTQRLFTEQEVILHSRDLIAGDFRHATSSIDTTLDPAQPTFTDSTDIVNFYERQYFKYCMLPYFDGETKDMQNITDKGNDIIRAPEWAYIDQTRETANIQLTEMIKWLCRMLDLEVYDKDGNCLVEVIINTHTLSKSKDFTEEKIFQLKNGMSDPIECYAQLNNMTTIQAERCLDKVKENQKKYKDVIFFAEKTISELEPTNPDGEGHSEDMGDKHKATKDMK